MTKISLQAAGLLIVVTVASGYSVYKDQIPNGEQVPHPCKANYMWRGVGHLNARGGGERNVFGRDFKAQGATWNKILCEMDSDGDGLTNGQELGDPHCTWSPGALPNRTDSISHPGVCDPWSAPNCLQNNSWVDCEIAAFHCDAIDNDPDVKSVSLRFLNTSVPSNETNYFCMTFDLPSDDVYQLVANEPIIDNDQVMHHILVYGCDDDELQSFTTPQPCGMEATEGCMSIIALWQVGASGSCTHPSTGFVFGKGHFTRVKMEIHWNNPELRSDYTDSSGVKFYYTPNLRATAAATMTVGQMNLDIPPLQPSVQIGGLCSSDCTKNILSQPVYVVEAANHMHYMGRSQKVELFRNGTLQATITNDIVYSYDAPVKHVHNPPIEILPGDEIRTTCHYSSQYKTTATKYGDATSDEMCFAFLTVYPSEALATRTCMGYGERSFCWIPRPPEEQCDGTTFLNASVPEMAKFMVDTSTHCKAFGPCTPKCREVLQFMKDNPCMRGQDFESVKFYMRQTPEGVELLAKMTSCELNPPCPQCPACSNDDDNDTTTATTANTNTGNNNNGNNTGGAAGTVANLMSVLFLLVFVLVL